VVVPLAPDMFTRGAGDYTLIARVSVTDLDGEVWDCPAGDRGLLASWPLLATPAMRPEADA
jgi:hypothetical protein